MKSEELDLIIPVAIESDWIIRRSRRGASDVDEERLAAESVAGSILEQHRRYGFTRFALAMPCKGWRSVGYPPPAHFLEQAEFFRKIQALLPDPIRCGWWHTLVLKSGPTPGLTRIVREDGTEAPFSTCPLDPEYRRRFAADVTAVLTVCKPDFLLLEDDFGMNCHGGRGCFCRRHLEEFAEREGRFYSREELHDLFAGDPEGSRELLRRFQLLQRDSLVLFAQAVREAADRVMPELPIGYDQPGCSRKDGDSVEAVARALAGKRTTPWVRFCGTFYGIDSIDRIPAQLFCCLYYRQHIAGEFGFYHESDSYPHTRFHVSASQMRVFMSAAYSYGYGGSVFQTQQLLDDPNEETAYGTMFAEERKRFLALREKTIGCRVRGVQLHHDPFDAANFPKYGPAWLDPLAAMGIPHTSEEAETAFISGNQLRFADDAAVRKYLAKGLFLDGLAAKVLCERGYGEYLGVDVRSPLVEGNEKFDLEAREIIDPKFIPESRGRNMPRGDNYSPWGNGELHRIEIADPACETITEIVTFRGEPMAPGMTRYRNRLGGTVVVYATEVYSNASNSLFNYRMQKLLQELIRQHSDTLPMVKNGPRVFLIVNEAPADRDHLGVLTCINLCPDPLEKTELHLPPAWREKIIFRQMDSEGIWQKADLETTADGIVLRRPLLYTRPVYLLAEKEG